MIAVFGVSTLVPQANYKVARAKQDSLKTINFCARCKFINSCRNNFCTSATFQFKFEIVIKNH